MKYYYHEKERLNKLFSGVGKVKVPVTIFLRDRSQVTLSPIELRGLSTLVGIDDKKIKTMFSNKNVVGPALMNIREKFKKININTTRRKK